MVKIVGKVSLINVSCIRKFYNEFVLENKKRYLYGDKSGYD